MKAFIVTIIVLEAIALAGSLFNLITGEFPVKRDPKTVGSEAAGAIFQLGFLVWASVILALS